ncbi:MAG: hypothetical protein LBL62_12775 [Planctomycetaceae bacterium]|nr:hypothetical protein [Planctomycetaceae bacterium]
MSLFDPGNRTAARHILQVDENEFLERYNPIIRRLRMASESVDVQTEMEDDFMKELQDKERAIAEKNKLIKELKEQLAKSQI